MKQKTKHLFQSTLKFFWDVTTQEVNVQIFVLSIWLVFLRSTRIIELLLSPLHLPLWSTKSSTFLKKLWVCEHIFDHSNSKARMHTLCIFPQVRIFLKTKKIVPRKSLSCFFFLREPTNFPFPPNNEQKIKLIKKTVLFA